MVHDCTFAGELTDFGGGTSSVLTPFLWRINPVTRLVFNRVVVGEGLGVVAL